VQDGLFFKVRGFPGTVAKHSKPIKNIIFASTGPKPELVLEDATTNDIRIVKHQEHVLVYDREIGEHGLLWNELLDWWVASNLKSLSKQSRAAQSLSLVKRLGASLGDNEPEKSVFYTYCNYASTDKVSKLPALIPQVYLHYDPYTMRQLAGQKNLVRQRMDFLLLLPNHVKVVIEIDGKQHYSTDGIADPKLYAEMVAEDRRLKLGGYDVYRFGGKEFARPDKGAGVVKEFFERLFELHSIFK